MLFSIKIFVNCLKFNWIKFKINIRFSNGYNFILYYIDLYKRTILINNLSEFFQKCMLI